MKEVHHSFKPHELPPILTLTGGHGVIIVTSRHECILAFVRPTQEEMIQLPSMGKMVGEILCNSIQAWALRILKNMLSHKASPAYEGLARAVDQAAEYFSLDKLSIGTFFTE